MDTDACGEQIVREWHDSRAVSTFNRDLDALHIERCPVAELSFFNTDHCDNYITVGSEPDCFIHQLIRIAGNINIPYQLKPSIAGRFG